MRITPLIIAAIGLLGVAAASSPARADDDDDGWRRHEWREHRWREHEWRGQYWHQYAPPPPVVYVPPPVRYYSMPAPSYYAPPPAYYAPPPPVYAAPGVSIGFGFGLRSPPPGRRALLCRATIKVRNALPRQECSRVVSHCRT
jgi:hypothetical protein